MEINIPSLEISEEREFELLEAMAKKICDYSMDVPAILFLTPLIPLGHISSQLTLLPLAPFFEAFGEPGFDYVALFKKPGNVEKLIKKIEDRRNSVEKKSENNVGLYNKMKFFLGRVRALLPF